MLRLALVGKNISHSKSQEMYENILKEEVSYKLLDYSCAEDIDSLHDIFQENDGLSITSPYKRHFLNYVETEEEIKSLDAINCIFKKNDLFYATNTDYLAVKDILKDKYLDKNLVILGDGVMSRITIAALNELGLSFKQYSRRIDGDLNKVNFSGKDQLIINTCNRDFKFNNSLPVDSVFWDYNYSFKEHVSIFENSDICYIDGMELLRLQAKYALKFWGILE